MRKINSFKVEAKFTDFCLFLVMYDYKPFPLDKNCSKMPDL